MKLHATTRNFYTLCGYLDNYVIKKSYLPTPFHGNSVGKARKFSYNEVFLQRAFENCVYILFMLVISETLPIKDDFEDLFSEKNGSI